MLTRRNNVLFKLFTFVLDNYLMRILNQKQTFIMKTFIALLFAVNMFGNINPDYIATSYYDPSVSISFENWTKGKLSVTISAEDGTVIFDDKLDTRKSDGVKYNLRNLASGKYDITLENNRKKVVETVILFDGKIVEKDEAVYYKPVVELMNDKIKVNFLSFTADATVKIYRDNEIIYEESFEGLNLLNKVFNTSKLDSGSYVFFVSDKNTHRAISFEK